MLHRVFNTRIMTYLKRILVVGVALFIGVPLCATLALWLSTLMGRVTAEHYLYQMRGWEMPLETEVIDFELLYFHGPAGNTCFLTGTLILGSGLSEDALTDFYTSRYHPDYRTATYNQVKAQHVTGNRYIVSAEAQYYCP